MSRKDRTRRILDPSSEALLAEHERLSNLYIYNAEMGEKRVSLYLTVISVGIAALLGLAQFHIETGSFIWTTIGFLAGIVTLGTFTFQRLVERRILATEYLRAINRIHRYFAQNDPGLEHYFYWPPCDDTPSFGQSGLLTGLRDVIAILNSLFIGILTVEIVFVMWPSLNDLAGILLGIAAGVISWGLHYLYETTRLGKAEKKFSGMIRFSQGG